MEEAGYRRQLSADDMAVAERTIRRASVLSLVVLAVTAPLAWTLLPALVDFPRHLDQRLAFAAQASLPALLCLLTAVTMVSTGRRFSPDDIGGSAAGPPGPRIAVQSAFLQNTLEQTVLAVGAYFAYAATLGGSALSLILVAVVLFVTGRVLFYRGYRRGVTGRAFGMTLTMMPTLLLYLVAVIAVVTRMF